MNTVIKLRRSFIPLAVITILIFLIFTFLPALSPLYKARNQIWKGYYTLLLSEKIRYEDLEAVLKQARILTAEGRGLAEETVTVEFSVFDSMESTTISSLEGRFDREDPRLDPYMTGLNRYFRGDSWARLFVPSRLPLALFFIRLYFSLPGYLKDWRIADFNIHNKLIRILLSLLFFMALLFLKKTNKSTWVLGIGYLPWLIGIIAGDQDLISFYLLYPAWFLVLDHTLDYPQQYLFYGWKEPVTFRVAAGYIYLGALALLLIVARISAGSTVAGALRILLPIGADLSLVGPYLLLIYSKYRRSRNGHPIFIPVAMLRRRMGPVVRSSPLILLSFLVLVTPFLLRLVNPGLKAFVPVPQKLQGVKKQATLSWSLLELLWTEGEADDLPNIADYIAHMAYQEGLLFGVEYRFPRRDQALYISSYNKGNKGNEDNEGDSGATILKSKRLIRRLDDEWLQGLLVRTSVPGLERMLIDQGYPVRVVMEPLHRIQPGFTWSEYSILLLFTVFILFCFDFFTLPVVIYATERRTA